MLDRLLSFAHADRALSLLNAYSAVTALVAALAWAIDARTLDGLNVWIKPLKFSISILVLSLTLGWLLTRLPGQGLARLLVRVVAALLAGELVLITVQAARGVRSHFNAATAFDTAVFAVMGVMIGAAMVCCLVLAVLAWRYGQLAPPSRLAATAGLVLMAAGGFMGYRMGVPTRSQMAEMRQRRVEVVGSHFAGEQQPARVLPVLGWATHSGDWRWVHFVGLHGLQLLLLLAWALEATALGPGARAAVVGVAVLACTGLFIWAYLITAQGRGVIG